MLKSEDVPIYYRVKIVDREDGEIIFNDVTVLGPENIDDIRQTIEEVFDPEHFATDIYPA